MTPPSCPATGAATDADPANIREQIRQLKEAYEARIEALERRLIDAETIAAKAPAEPAARKQWRRPQLTGAGHTRKHLRERV